jgi:diguanylate cyclase (GGDEF)-like protein
MNPNPEQLRILFLASNPLCESRLALDEEARNIQSKIRASEYSRSISFSSRWAVRPDDILQAINEIRPNIVHFSGHGSPESGLVLHFDPPKGVRIGKEALGKVFSAFKPDVRLVFLNTCYSSDFAEVIAESVDFVIGMRSSISDEAARCFAASFYRALGFNKSVKAAFDQALASLALEGYSQSKDSFPAELVVHRRRADIHRPFLFSDGEVCGAPAFQLAEPNGGDRANAYLRKQRSIALDKDAGKLFLMEKIDSFLEQSSCKSFAIALLDIDDLTIINKHFGDIVGDKVLEKIISILEKHTGNSFRNGRCGDDTFYIVMPKTRRIIAWIFLKYLLRKVRRFHWNAIAEDLRVTCSCGFATFLSHGTIHDTIVRAAIGMNIAKNKGKNRVTEGPLELWGDAVRNLDRYYS